MVWVPGRATASFSTPMWALGIGEGGNRDVNWTRTEQRIDVAIGLDAAAQRRPGGQHLIDRLKSAPGQERGGKNRTDADLIADRQPRAQT